MEVLVGIEIASNYVKGNFMLIVKKINFWIALVILVFGVLTIASGGRALFTESGINSRGNIIPLVLWFNFIAGFFYVIAGISTFKLKKSVIKISMGLAFLNVFVFVYLLNHIYQGGLYENKTLVAMGFRTAFWLVFAVYFQKSDLFKKIE